MKYVYLQGSRFESDQLGGAGDIGAVRRACDRRIGDRVALELLRGDGVCPDLAERCDREAQLLSSRLHPASVSSVAHGAHG